MADPSEVLDLPDRSTCLFCGRRIDWDSYGYVHRSGWADCRDRDVEAEAVMHALAGKIFVRTAHPIELPLDMSYG